MSKTFSYTIVDTPAGWVALAGRDGKISALEFPKPTREEALGVLSAGIPGRLVESNGEYDTLSGQIRDYFSGRKTEFTFEPDFDGLTPFQQDVLRLTKEIPYGTVVTYGWLARTAGRPGAARAAGQALGRNTIPVAIPCHRVVAAGGGLGGFSAGLHWKERLLKMEGAI